MGAAGKAIAGRDIFADGRDAIQPPVQRRLTLAAHAQEFLEAEAAGWFAGKTFGYDWTSSNFPAWAWLRAGCDPVNGPADRPANSRGTIGGAGPEDLIPACRGSDPEELRLGQFP